MPQNLTTLASVKAWAGVTGTGDDPLLTRLIGACSRGVLSYLERPSLAQAAYTDTADGKDTVAITLRQWPVLSVGALSVDGHAITAAQTFGGAGYRLAPWDGSLPGRPQQVSLGGGRFWRGYANVSVSYTAGYVVQGELQTVEAGQIAPSAPYGSWCADQGVTYLDGQALTPVAASPAQGQYSVNPATGVYTFNAADANQVVLLSYSFIPADIEQACIEWVAERYSYKGRIGNASVSLNGQQTASYSLKDMPDFIRLLLQPYRRVI